MLDRRTGAVDLAGGGGAGGGGDASASRPVFAREAPKGLKEALGFEPPWVSPGMERPAKAPGPGTLPAVQPLAVHLFLAYEHDRERLGLPYLSSSPLLEMMGRMVGRGHKNLWGATREGTYRPPSMRGATSAREQQLMTFLDLLCVTLSTPPSTIEAFGFDHGFDTTTLKAFVNFLRSNGCHVTHGAKPTLGALAWREQGDRCHAMPDLVGFQTGEREDKRRWELFPAQPLPRQHDGTTVWDVQWGEGSEGLAPERNRCQSYFGMLYATGVRHHVSFDPRSRYTLAQRLEWGELPEPGRDITVRLTPLTKPGRPSVTQVKIAPRRDGVVALNFLDGKGKLQHTTHYHQEMSGDHPCVEGVGDGTWYEIEAYVRAMLDEATRIDDPGAPHASNCTEGQNRSAAFLIRQAMRRSILASSRDALPSGAPALALWTFEKIQEHSERVGIKLDLTKQWMNLAIAAYAYLPADIRPAKAEWMQTLWALQAVATSVSGARDTRDAMYRLLGREGGSPGMLRQAPTGAGWFTMFEESLAVEGGDRDAAGLMEGFEQTVRGLMAAAWRYEHDGELASAEVTEVYRSVLGERPLKNLLPTCYQDAAARAAASPAAAAAEGRSTGESATSLWWAADGGGGGRGASESERGAGVRASGHPVALAGKDEDWRVPTDQQEADARKVQVDELEEACETPRVLQGEVLVDDEAGRQHDTSGEDQSHSKPGQSSLRWVGPSVAGVGVATVLSALVLYRTQAVLSVPMSAVHGVFFAGVALMVLGAMAHLVLRRSDAQGLPKVANGQDAAASSDGGAGPGRTTPQPPSTPLGQPASCAAGVVDDSSSLGAGPGGSS